MFNEKGLLVDTVNRINPVGKNLVITNEKVNNKKNFLLMGDIPADTNMIEHVDHENVISFGFLNNPKDYKQDV